MHTKNFAILSILAVVIVSGCTGTTSTSGVEFSQIAGVVINDFSLDTDALFENELTTLNIQVQNVGAKAMTTSSQLWIYGPVMDGSTPQVWAVTAGSTSKTLDTVSFSPPDVARKIPGSLVVETLDLTAPSLGLAPGMSNPYTFYARVCYPYSTTTFSNINEISKNEIRISNPPTSDAITRATAGPIQMKLLSGDTVLSGKKLTLVFEVSNVGGGFTTLPAGDCTAMNPDINQKDTDKLRVMVTVDGQTTSCDGSKDVNIRQAKNVVCTYTPAAGTNPTTSHTVIATATYNYLITKEAYITVKSEQ
ncbi:hypothetical protein L6303_05550 [archaeon]|nr:hypothetical protein [Nanoarchaeota archaeon]MBU4300541.1 hypothetical protein [Nanoarchaeota archaeon]MCG2724182.1 hypothetical protein [archaeon]